ncbi:MAG: hypothetical protein AB8G96_09700 [Phycisphaerales bacterium]
MIGSLHHPMRRRSLDRGIVLALLTLAGLVFGGCVHDDVLRDPVALEAPWSGSVLYGVAPVINESGTTVADSLKIADAIHGEVQRIDGVDAVPVNRVINAMRELNLRRVSSEHEAQAICRVLNLDGLVVGTVSTWNPYRPMVLGLALELHRRDAPAASAGVAAAVAMRPGAVAPDPSEQAGGVISAAAVFDASNHRTLKSLRHYADARHAPDQAYGPDLYLVSIDRFTQFAAHRLLETMIQAMDERGSTRLAGGGTGR